MPDNIIEWSAKIQGTRENNELLMEYITMLLGRISLMRDRGVADLANAMPAIIEIDRELSAWASGTIKKETYQFTTVIIDGCTAVFAGYYHVYKDSWAATLWNYYRCAVILTHELKIHYLSLPHLSESTQMVSKSGDGLFYDPYMMPGQPSEDTIQSMCLDICASVPFYFNFQGCDKSCTGSPDPIHCQSLIWPLYVASSMDQSSDMMRGWAMVQLIRLGQIIGTKQTSTLAALLQSKEHISDWLIRV